MHGETDGKERAQIHLLPGNRIRFVIKIVNGIDDSSVITQSLQFNIQFCTLVTIKGAIVFDCNWMDYD